MKVNQITAAVSYRNSGSGEQWRWVSLSAATNSEPVAQVVFFIAGETN